MIEIPIDLAIVGARQHGALTRRQIVGGVGRAGLRDLLARGVLLDSGHRGVYVIAGSRRTRRRDLAAQLLRLGTGAAAADDTALALHGVAGFSLQSEFRAAIPTSRRVRNPGCRVLHTDLGEADRTVVHDLCSMTVARALVGVARRGIDGALRSAIDDALRRDLCDTSELARIAHALPRHPGAAALRGEISAGTFVHESEGERRLARLFRPNDPRPAWQAVVLPGIRADGAYLEARMTMELNSRQWHLQPGDQDRDSARRLRLAEAGIEEIVVTAGMLRDEPETTRKRILAVRAQRIADGVEPLVPWSES